jgi:hypothetical protein
MANSQVHKLMNFRLDMPVVHLLLFFTDLEIFVIITRCLTGLFLAIAELNKREINNFNLSLVF